MKVLEVSLWLNGKRTHQMLINAEGRLDYNFPPGEDFDRLTVEPHDPNSKVQFTPEGSVYRTINEAAAEIKRLEAHKRAQSEDIMTLGQMVGRLEAELKLARAGFGEWSVEPTSLHKPKTSVSQE